VLGKKIIWLILRISFDISIFNSWGTAQKTRISATGDIKKLGEKKGFQTGRMKTFNNQL